MILEKLSLTLLLDGKVPRGRRSGSANRICFFPPPVQDDPMTNLNTAFDVAEKYLDIPKMLDAEGKTCFKGYQ